VGRSIATALEKAHVHFVVVDMNEAKLKDRGFDYYVGNGTDEEILIKAGLKDASTVIIVLNNDDDIIFATLIARNINRTALSCKGKYQQNPSINIQGRC